MDRLVPLSPEVIAPGCVHLPGWIEARTRVELVEQCRAWTAESGGAVHPRMPDGSSMSVAMVGLGWHWYPYRYSRTRDDGDGGRAEPFPEWLRVLAGRALSDAAAVDESLLVGSAEFIPDVALINWYEPGARMGMHVDRDEADRAPVISFSVGCTGLFRFGTPSGRGRPWRDVPLESGDVVVFGGPSRMAYHGVPRLVRATDDPVVGVLPGRLNVTVRQTGLDG